MTQVIVRRKVEGSDELYHFGVQGQKWGIRRYQNADGSLTAAGRAHYGYGDYNGPITKRGFKKALKKIDKGAREIQENKHELDNAYKKGKITTKDYKKTSNALVKTMEKQNSAANKIVAKALENAYNVKITKINKAGPNTQSLIKKLQLSSIPVASIAASAVLGATTIALPGIIPAAAVGGIGAGIGYRKFGVTSSNKYKLQKKKNGETGSLSIEDKRYRPRR